MSVPFRRLAVTALVLVALLASGALALDRLAADGSTGRLSGPVGSRSVAPAGVPSLGPAVPPAMTLPGELRLSAEPLLPAQPAVLSLPDGFPTDGPGSFQFARTEGEVLGGSGKLHRFRLAIEDGIDQPLAELAETVDGSLGDRRSWTAAGDLRFQRVPGGASHDFTVYLVTSGTAGRMCAAGGLDVIGTGLPDGGVSCQTAGKVILNLSRWQQSVPEFVAADVPLQTYRQMLVNHEVGHQLGYGHEGCPEAGAPAPVMMQQTLDLAGCLANAWPFLDGRRHTGPLLG
jgi:hypothetical protein